MSTAIIFQFICRRWWLFVDHAFAYRMQCILLSHSSLQVVERGISMTTTSSYTLYIPPYASNYWPTAIRIMVAKTLTTINHWYNNKRHLFEGADLFSISQWCLTGSERTLLYRLPLSSFNKAPQEEPQRWPFSTSQPIMMISTSMESSLLPPHVYHDINL